MEDLNSKYKEWMEASGEALLKIAASGGGVDIFGAIGAIEVLKKGVLDSIVASTE